MNEVLDDLLKIYLSTIDSYNSKIYQTVNDKYTIIDKSMITVYLFIKIIEDRKEQNDEVAGLIANYLLKQNIYMVKQEAFHLKSLINQKESFIMNYLKN